MVLLTRSADTRPAFCVPAASGARYGGDGVRFWEVRGKVSVWWSGVALTCRTAVGRGEAGLKKFTGVRNSSRRSSTGQPSGARQSCTPNGNFIGGLAIGASLVIDTRVGIVTWLAAAAHEVPQELGDFGILVRGGWPRMHALVANFVSATAILPGGLLAYYLSGGADVAVLLSSAAGNFIYIAASDLIPEIKHDRLLRNNLVHFGAFLGGIALILLTRLTLA